MRHFLAFISEALEVKQLKHLTHVEDHVINSGHEGFEHAHKTLSAVHSQLSGHGETHGVKVTEKFDGAPSIVFGHDPKTKKFFVASKSAFNKNPKINYTEADIERNHGHAPGLVEKLKAALAHLKKTAPKEGVYQGDVMYTKPDLDKDGGYYHFTPNTVTHSVDVNSEEGKKVGRAKIGVVVHTKYEGDDLSNMAAGFDVDHDKFKSHKDAHVINPEMHFQGQYSPLQQRTVDMHLRKARAHHAALGKRGYAALHGHEVHLNTYINSTVRNGTQPTTQGYKAYLAARKATEVASVKTEKTKKIKAQHHDDLIAHVDKKKTEFEHAFAAHHHLQQAKHQLVSALGTHNRGIHYTINGKKSQPEGFVAILKNKQGESMPSKLVDRSPTGFAMANLTGSGKFQKQPADKKKK